MKGGGSVEGCNTGLSSHTHWCVTHSFHCFHTLTVVSGGFVSCQIHSTRA